MKAKNYSGTIKTFPNLPKSYNNIIGGFDLLSDSELESYGFYDVVIPSYDASIKEVGAIEWDASNSVFTYPVSDKTWTETLEELKVVRNLELGLTDDTNLTIKNERAAIRTICTDHETAINSKTTKSQVQSYNITY